MLQFCTKTCIWVFCVFAVLCHNNCKWLFYSYFWPFTVNCMFTFHKTEVQTVILMCLIGLKSDWFKGYDTKCKYFNFWCFAILYKNTYLHFLHFCILCGNYCTYQDLEELSNSKWWFGSLFCERQYIASQKMARNVSKMTIYQ